MTSLQKKVFLALAIAIALTRLLAVSETLFDWDEGLFALGIREYDVVHHHPHPPGYPLFIAAAKLLHAIGVEEFRALQAIVVLGAMLLFPAVYLLARELGFGFATASGGAALFCFLPNVWVYGGTGFSDVPALTLTLFASWLLLRSGTLASSPAEQGASSLPSGGTPRAQPSGRRRSAYIAGAIVLGIAAGIRPPSLVIALVPALLATWQRLRARDFLAIAAAILLGGGIVAASYLGAAYATGSLDGYLDAVKKQSDYVRDIDSWRSPEREPLHEAAKDFFLRPVRQQLQMYGLVLLGLISAITSIAKRRRATLLTLAVFAPFAILAWLTLDVYAAGRYSMPYLVAYAILAVDGLGILARHRVRVQAVLVAIVVSVFAVWTWPALALQRAEVSPPIAALRWVKANVPPEQLVYLNIGLGPQSDYVMPERQTFWENPEDLSALDGDAWVVDLKEVAGGRNFTWPRTNPIWKILRRRNFEASVWRAKPAVTFGPEWYPAEGAPRKYRWIPVSATAALPAMRGNAKLHLRMYVPVETLGAAPAIEVTLNGAVVERFAGSEPLLAKTWTVPSRADAPNELRVTTSAVVNPAKIGQSADTRDLGLRIDALSWTSAN